MNFASTSFSLPPISDRVLVIETVNDIVDVNILEGAVTNVGWPESIGRKADEWICWDVDINALDKVLLPLNYVIRMLKESLSNNFVEH
jgi:hypothetical protein